MSDFKNYLFEKFIKNHKRLKKLISLTGYCKQDDMYWGSSDNYEQYVSYEVWKYQQARVDELKTQLAVYKEDMQRDAEKIGELYAVLKCVSEHFEMNDLDGCMPRVFEMIQEALRGEHENN